MECLGAAGSIHWGDPVGEGGGEEGRGSESPGDVLTGSEGRSEIEEEDQMLIDLGSIPGFTPEPERGYAYVRSSSPQYIRQFMRGMKYQPGARKPAYGTMRYVEKVLTTPEGDHYFAVSLNGDSEGWRAALQAYADSKAVIIGKLVGEYLEIASAKRIPLRDCSVASTWDDR